MNTSIEELRRDAAEEIARVGNAAQLDEFRVKYLARKGRIAALFDRLKEVPAADRPAAGKALNELRRAVEGLFDERKNGLGASGTREAAPAVDLTLPGRRPWPGSQHPITQTLDDIQEIFRRMGFTVASGPEIEDDYHNFGALNFPPDHPARDMQDTFFLPDKMLLRTHTTSVQIRLMESGKPPLRAIMPGRVYRNEAISARSYCLFHQVDGIYIDRGVTFSELKGTLVTFARQFYGSSLKYRFRA